MKLTGIIAILVIHFVDGSKAYDDTLPAGLCHAIAEGLIEGGELDIPGIPSLMVETARCEEVRDGWEVDGKDRPKN